MMPIILKDQHTWSQTKDMLYVRVSVKGIRADKTSFITSDNYIRVPWCSDPPSLKPDVIEQCKNAMEIEFLRLGSDFLLYNPPYYFELFLWGEVDETNGKCTLNEKDAQVVFELPKRHGTARPPQTDRSEESGDTQRSEDETEEWPCLELTNLNRFQKHEIRTRACDASRKRAELEIQAALQKRSQNKQMTVQEQIRLDEEARARVTAIKTFESEEFMAGMNGWDDEIEMKTQAEENNALLARLAASLNPKTDLDKIDGLETTKYDNISRDQIWSKLELASKSTTSRSSLSRSSTKEEQASNPSPTIAPVRQGGSIKVSFTPREFPTPSRESTAQHEEEWLAKQLEARKNSGFDELNLKPEEKDPSWLLEKGHKLLSTGSYLGAASAFSTGIKIAPKLPQLYVGRAQAQYAMGNLIKTVEDATQALQLLTPKVAQNMIERQTCHRCRAQAFRKLGMYKEAICDYREALQLDPENEQLKDEYTEVQKEELDHNSNSDDEDDQN